MTNELYVYDWDPIGKTLIPRVGFNPYYLPNCSQALGIALDETRGILWVADGYAGVARAYNITTWIENTTMSFTPSHRPIDIAVDRLRGFVYTVSMYPNVAWLPPGGSNLISKWDLATGTETTVDMGHDGIGISVNEVTGFVYVTGGMDQYWNIYGNLEVWDPSTSSWTKVQDTGTIGYLPAWIYVPQGRVEFIGYDVTIKAYCGTEGKDVNVSIVMDGIPTNFSTPHTFRYLKGTPNFTVPSSDLNGHPFLGWSTSETIIIIGHGTYIAYYGFAVKAVVLDSWGTDFSDFTSTWDTLNAYWNLFGNKMIYIDYTSLNKENITYQDIAATGADVLIISSAYDPFYGWEFTDSEIEAIRQYVYEGHGLIITGLTFYYYVPNNNKLAPLVGLNETIVYDFYSWTDSMDLLEPTHPLFMNIPDPYPASKYTSIPSDGNWDLNELAGGTYLALGTYLESAIAVCNGLVYISPMVEYYPTDYDLQLLYNVITWSRYGLHDITITDVTPLKTVVGQGYSMNINVTVANQGDFTETFNVTLYANTTTIETKQITLTNGASTTITFTWDTTGFAKGNYTIWAYAWPVQGETDTADNTLFDGVVYVGVPCDVSGPTQGVPDGICNMRDIGYICAHFVTTPTSPNWNPNCDITGPTPKIPDDVVNMRDIGEACNNFGKTDP